MTPPPPGASRRRGHPTGREPDAATGDLSPARHLPRGLAARGSGHRLAAPGGRGRVRHPRLQKDVDYASDAELYDAADEHARHLRRAQRNLEDALNRARVLAESVSGIGDSRAVQTETVLNIVDRKLNNALNRLDRHDSRHQNLFFAYLDLKARSEEEAE